ncbi:Nuclear pore complex protein NUP85-like protein [Drosera capensis]
MDHPNCELASNPLDGDTYDQWRRAMEVSLLVKKKLGFVKGTIKKAKVKGLTWLDGALLGVSQTKLLLNKLQELSFARLRPDNVEADLPPQALGSARLTLATNLGRACLKE